MSLFGAIYAAAFLGKLAKSSIEEQNKDYEARKRARLENKPTYIDRLGHERLVSNGHMTAYSTNEKGERVKIDMETQEIVLNINENRIRIEKEKAIKCNSSAYMIPYNIKVDEKSKSLGQRYGDVLTDDIYICRRINGDGYYINVNTGLIDRPTDFSIFINHCKKKYGQEHHSKEYFDSFIKNHNENIKNKYTEEDLKYEAPSIYFVGKEGYPLIGFDEDEWEYKIKNKFRT